jgi:Tfp pilus assembly protein PilF
MDSRTLSRVLLLLLLPIGLAACANKAQLREQAGGHINVGSAYLGSGQYNAALKELLEAEKLTPDDPKVHYLLGISYHGKGLDEKAIAEFQRALSLNPDESEVHNFLGAIYLEKGRYDDAIASFERALSNILYDTPAATLYNIGRAYYEKGQYETALKHYREAAAKEPYTILMPLIEKNMGAAWLAKGNPKEAVVHLRKSLDLAPSLAESHYWLGLSYQALKQPDMAAASFRTAVKLAPESEIGRKAKEQLKTVTP